MHLETLFAIFTTHEVRIFADLMSLGFWTSNVKISHRNKYDISNKYVALGTKNICGREIFKKFYKEFYGKLYEINLIY